MKTKLTFITFILNLVAIAAFSQAQEVVLSLDEALRLAKQNNKTLQVQYMEEKVAAGSVKEARSAMLPSISAHGNYAYYFNRQVIFMPGSFAGNENEPVVDVAVGGRNTVSTNVYLQQAIVNESARNQIRSSKLEAAIQSQRTRGLEGDMVVRISENYFNIQLLQASIELHQQSLERNNRALKDSRALYLQGKALKVDTLRNCIEVENLKSTVSYLSNRLEVHLLQLKNDLGISASTSISVTDSLSIDSNWVISTADEEQLLNRPDLQEGKLSVSLYKNYLEQSRAQRLPMLSLIGSYQLQAQADDLKFNAYNWPKTSLIGLQASVPIFTGNKINARISQSNWRLKQSQSILEQLHDNARTEKAMLENDLQESIKQVSIQQRTVEAASLSYRMIRDRYQNGLSSRIELADAELALTQAKLDQLQAVYMVRLTKLKYDRALGLLTF